jgi:hypothetical protein
MGLALLSHINVMNINPFDTIGFFYSSAVFLAFFGFGFTFYAIFGFVLIWLFIKGANVTVDFSKRLESRFGGKEEEDLKYKETEMSPFSIYKGGTLYQQQAFKFKMMFSAFAPLLIIIPIQIIIILVGLPNVAVPNLFTFNSSMLAPIFNSPTWAVLFLIEGLTIAIWIPILMSLAIRELSNSSTIRPLISSIAVGVAVSILFYFLRPIFII